MPLHGELADDLCNIMPIEWVACGRLKTALFKIALKLLDRCEWIAREDVPNREAAIDAQFQPSFSLVVICGGSDSFSRYFERDSSKRRISRRSPKSQITSILAFILLETVEICRVVVGHRFELFSKLIRSNGGSKFKGIAFNH